MRTAWILGAGFSYSLGGPLLADFFTDASRVILRPLVMGLGEERRTAISNVHKLYWNSDAGRRGDVPVRRPWSDPEAFLATIDTAVRNPDSRVSQYLAGLDAQAFHPGRIQAVWSAAATYVALLTDHFVPERRALAEELESWQPYLRWADRLKTRSAVTVSPLMTNVAVERCARSST